MNVLTLGHPKLHQKAAKVIDFGSLELQQDLDFLKKALKDLGGMGIAAPQLGLSRRLLLIHSKPNKRYSHAPKSALMVLINPVFKASIDVEEGWEGCLSVPGLRGLVSRSLSVLVTYQDVLGETQELQLDGFLARIFLHEYDHLEGLTFLDRVEDTTKLLSEQEYFRQVLEKEEP
jgi:peptide deformylase